MRRLVYALPLLLVLLFGGIAASAMIIDYRASARAESLTCALELRGADSNADSVRVFRRAVSFTRQCAYYFAEERPR